MQQISISQPVREMLRAALLDERDLLEGVRRASHHPEPGQAGSYRCSCEVAVRRPMDPETAELRRLDVTLRQAGGQWVIVGVEGLDRVVEP